MTALLEYLDLTALLEYIDLLNRYSGGPFQAGARGKMPQLPPPVGGPVHTVAFCSQLVIVAYVHLLIVTCTALLLILHPRQTSCAVCLVINNKE